MQGHAGTPKTVVKKQGAKPLRVEDQETGAALGVVVVVVVERTRLGGVTQGRRGSLCHKTEEGPWEPPTPGQSCAGGVYGGF